MIKPSLSVLPLCLLLNACSPSIPPDTRNALTPLAWQSPHTGADQRLSTRWWAHFASPQLDRLIAQAKVDSYDLAAAVARVQQARANAVIAGATLLPEVQLSASGNREKRLRDRGYNPLDTSDNNKAVEYVDTRLTARYEVDFWGGQAAARYSAGAHVKASEFDRATVELTVLSSVAERYVQTLALDEHLRIARLNLTNARRVLEVVQTRHDAGSATALELAQQKTLVARQQREVPLFSQQAHQARISLAVLLGEPVQRLALDGTPFDHLQWPTIDSGVPAHLLSRRPDVARAQANLAAAHADITVAQAAMLPGLTLSASLGSGAERLSDVLRNPFYSLAAGLAAPIFNNGRLSAERDKAIARQQELLNAYQASIVNAFADVEKALNNIHGLDQQRQWHDEELKQAQQAFALAETRYQAGADMLLTVLETQRVLYQAQDQTVQLRLARLQASIELYKALGGGWHMF